MTPEIEKAIEEIKDAFTDNPVDVIPENQGGAYVIVNDLSFGDNYIPEHGWIGFLIGFQYPRADVYPHFFDRAVMRKDKKPFGDGFSATQWNQREVWQISRRSKRLISDIDTAAFKLAKVLEWIRSQ